MSSSTEPAAPPDKATTHSAQLDVTSLLRAGHDLQACLRDTTPRPEHSWHREFENRNARKLNASTDTLLSSASSALAGLSATRGLAQRTLAWLKSVKGAALVFCSGKALQGFDTDFIRPGPCFCIAGTVTLVQTTGRQIPLGQLEASLSSGMERCKSSSSALPDSSNPSGSLGAHTKSPSVSSPVRVASSPGSGVSRWFRTKKGSGDCSMDSASSTLAKSAPSANVLQADADAVAAASATLESSVQWHRNAAARRSGSVAPEDTARVTDEAPEVSSPYAKQPEARIFSRCDSSASSCSYLSSGAVEDAVLADVRVIFSISQLHLPQTREFREGRYSLVSWPNILPPNLKIRMHLKDATALVSTHPRVPECCINA